MSDDRLAALRTLGREPVSSRPPAATRLADTEEGECQAFGYLRGVKEQALHLQFRLRTGERRSFPYSWLGPMNYDPSKGLELTFVGDRTWKVRVEGRNLSAVQPDEIDLLERGILRHRVIWVREMEPEDSRRLPEAALTVDRIVIEVEQTRDMAGM